MIPEMNRSYDRWNTDEISAQVEKWVLRAFAFTWFLFVATVNTANSDPLFGALWLSLYAAWVPFTAALAPGIALWTVLRAGYRLWLDRQ